jgi:parvulin-like peptidyl-prolyl isomerase
MLLVWLGIVGTVQSQSVPPRNREILWQQEVGAGRLTTPGRSRKLPPPDDGVAPTARVATADRPETREWPVADQQAPSDAPGDWWKEDAERTIGNPEQRSQGRGVSPQGEIIVSTQILAWVGNEPILAGDLLGRINEALAGAAGKIPESDLDKQRWVLMERLLPSAIESKMVYLDFVKRMQPEQIEMIRASVYEQFDEKQLPRLIEQAKVASAADLEMRLRSFGTSIENVRRSFFEQVAAREIIRRNTESEREVTHDELLDFYQQHLAEYEFPAQARWEHLMTRFAKFPTKRDAYQAIVDMGNEVLRGAKFETVARRGSHGPSAPQGGQNDWTTQGSLVSRALDDALFSLPVGAMSKILEDDDGFHIVRVIERKEAGRTSFVDAQGGIREKIQETRRDAEVKAYLERLKNETYVWNYFAQ